MISERILSDGRIERRVPTRVHTRKIDRAVAHKNMERAGLRKVNKKNKTTYVGPYGNTIVQDDGSYFANHWRDTTNVPTIDLTRKRRNVK